MTIMSKSETFFLQSSKNNIHPLPTTFLAAQNNEAHHSRATRSTFNDESLLKATVKPKQLVITQVLHKSTMTIFIKLLHIT